MRFITISREEWNALFAGKTQTLLRMPYERPDEYKAGDKLLGYAAVVQHMDALAMKRISHDRFTPAYYLHGVNFRLPRAVSACGSANSQEAARGSRPQYQQLDLFGSVA